MAAAEARHTQRQGHRLNAVETSSAPVVTDAAYEPLPCEPLRPATAITRLRADNGSQEPREPTEGEEVPTKGAALATADNRAGKRETFPIRKAAKAVLHVYRGANVTDACLATGIPRPTWYLWLRPAEAYPSGDSISPEAQRFAARIRHAFARAQALAGLKAQQSVYHAGQEAAGTREWRAHHEWLKHADATRARWREHRELKIEHTGAINHAHRLVQQMTDQELIEAAPAEWRELVDG